MPKSPGPSTPGKKVHHRHVAKALAHNEQNDDKKSLLIHYKKLNGRVVKRKVDPRSLRGNTLVAYDHRRKAIRSFRMERVQHMEKSAFWVGFEKQALSAGLAGRAAEAADRKMGPHILNAAFGTSNHLHGILDKKVAQRDRFAQYALGKKGGAAAELVGLGTLAAPSVAHFAGHDMSPNANHATELAGLGILAAPYAHDVGKKALTAGRKLLHRG